MVQNGLYRCPIHGGGSLTQLRLVKMRHGAKISSHLDHFKMYIWLTVLRWEKPGFWALFLTKSPIKYFNECISWTFSLSRSICCITTYQDFFYFLRVQANPKVSTRCMGIRSYLILTSKKGVRGEFSFWQSLLNTLTLPRKKGKTSNIKISILARHNYKYQECACQWMVICLLFSPHVKSVGSSLVCIEPCFLPTCKKCGAQFA